jgi:hypothetical protein
MVELVAPATSSAAQSGAVDDGHISQFQSPAERGLVLPQRDKTHH